MGAMPFAQHPAQKHREPACFCNGTFRAKSIAGMAAPTMDFLPGNAPWARWAHASRILRALSGDPCLVPG